MRQLVLHIGEPKTGSTFLQNTFREHRKQLSDNGWFYPDFFGEANHSRLVLAFDNTRSAGRLRRAGIDDRAKAIRTMGQVLSKNTQSNWLMSSESAARLRGDDLHLFIKFLRQYVKKITVIVYFRRQAFILSSVYSQQVKECRTRRPPSWQKILDERIPPIETYQTWREAVGRNNVIARPYMEGYKAHPDLLLKDFGQSTDIPWDSAWEPVQKHANVRLSAEGIRFLLAVNNQLFPPNTIDYKMRQSLVRHIMNLTPGDPLMVPIEVAQAASDAAREDNLQLVQALGDTLEWRQWLGQPLEQRGTEQLPELSDERIIELTAKLSIPAGPVDFSQPDYKPTMRSRRTLFLRRTS